MKKTFLPMLVSVRDPYGYIYYSYFLQDISFQNQKLSAKEIHNTLVTIKLQPFQFPSNSGLEAEDLIILTAQEASTYHYRVMSHKFTQSKKIHGLLYYIYLISISITLCRCRRENIPPSLTLMPWHLKTIVPENFCFFRGIHPNGLPFVLKLQVWIYTQK